MDLFPQTRNPIARLYLWATHRLYSQLAWAYDPVSWLVSLGRWNHWRRMALDHVQSGPILEIGFGTGQLLIDMTRRGPQSFDLDAVAITSGSVSRSLSILTLA